MEKLTPNFICKNPQIKHHLMHDSREESPNNYVSSNNKSKGNPTSKNPRNWFVQEGHCRKNIPETYGYQSKTDSQEKETRKSRIFK